jgi:hypothetical protein
MLFAKLFFKKYQSQVKQIQAYPNPGMFFYAFPGGFHVWIQINIVENKQAFVLNLFEAVLKIIQRCTFGMITIEKYKIELIEFIKSLGQGLTEITTH